MQLYKSHYSLINNFFYRNVEIKAKTKLYINNINHLKNNYICL